jgi:hypothetical protein
MGGERERHWCYLAGEGKCVWPSHTLQVDPHLKVVIICVKESSNRIIEKVIGYLVCYFRFILDISTSFAL